MKAYVLPVLLLTACAAEEYETKQRKFCNNTQYLESYFSKSCEISSPIEDVEKFAGEWSDLLKVKPECGSFFELNSYCEGYW